MSESILTSTKKNLGLSEDYDAFDSDVLLWINDAFSTLRDLGLGPEGFFVEDKDKVWAEFEPRQEAQGLIKPYVYLRAKVMFDPPATTHVMTAMNEQIREKEFRLGTIREHRDWTPPTPEPESDEL